MSRVLIVAYRVFTHDARLRRNAEALASRGDSVDVVCLGMPGHSYTGPEKIISFPALRYRGKSKARYLVHYLHFFWRAFSIITRRSLRRRYDIVMAISMPDALVFGCLVAKILGSKVILDITDMMPELYRDRFGSKLWDLGGKVLSIEERLSAKAADPCLVGRFLINAPNFIVGPRQPANLNRRCKDPILRQGELSRLPPGLQRCQQFTGNGQLLPGLRGLHVVHMLTHDAALHQQFVSKPIHIGPP